MTEHPAATLWPSLRVDAWEPTRDTLHMWTQIIGKVRMAHAPMVNHWWQVPLYVSPRGLSTSTIPTGTRNFDMEFDFVDHALSIRVSDGRTESLPLADKSVSEFHDRTAELLGSLGIPLRISKGPNEVAHAIPFAEDQRRDYDPTAARLFWQQLVQADRVIGRFRSRFAGKVSPVHFFWGSFDLACTRFSGRSAPPHPGGAPNCADWVMVEGYSHELSSCGFWPGGGDEGAFYSYAYPEPAGYADFPGCPEGAYYDKDFRQFLLPYETARRAADPDRIVTEFLEFTYAAAAESADWDRDALDRDPRVPSHRAQR
jgi:hypothetical protein